MSDNSSAIVTPIIYREYILKHFQTTISPEYKEVDFIIGFASEDYNSNGQGSGNFHPTWNLVSFSPEKVKKLKEKYPEVRVVISVGGVGDQYPFNPVEKHIWIVKAVHSIKEIIHRYEHLIDGIDIHYDVIESSPEDFSFCIGQLIKKLKNDPSLSIKVVSLAPTEVTQSHYKKLYFDHQNYIDFVDYLFTKFSTFKEFVEFYKKLVADYSAAKVLPGFLNPSPDGRIKEAILYLIKNKLAPGFFTYPSHDSPDPPGPLSLQELLQNISK